MLLARGRLPEFANAWWRRPPETVRTEKAEKLQLPTEFVRWDQRPGRERRLVHGGLDCAK